MSSGPEKYQKVISDALENCIGVANIVDDIIVYGKGPKKHDGQRDTVLCMLSECGLTLNKKKCRFRLSKLTFFGHNLSTRGIDASEEKVAAIQAARQPQNARKTRSFMRLVQYSAKFIPDLVIGKPILDLTRKDAKFHSGPEQESEFNKLKRLVFKAETLAYFRKKCKTRIVVDASSRGLCNILTQMQGGIWRVVAYLSTSLSDVERRYNQTEKKTLVLVWACE